MELTLRNLENSRGDCFGISCETAKYTEIMFSDDDDSEDDGNPCFGEGIIPFPASTSAGAAPGKVTVTPNSVETEMPPRLAPSLQLQLGGYGGALSAIDESPRLRHSLFDPFSNRRSASLTLPASVTLGLPGPSVAADGGWHDGSFRDGLAGGNKGAIMGRVSEEEEEEEERSPDQHQQADEDDESLIVDFPREDNDALSSSNCNPSGHVPIPTSLCDSRGRCVRHPHNRLRRKRLLRGSGNKWQVLMVACPDCCMEEMLKLSGDDAEPPSIVEGAAQGIVDGLPGGAAYVVPLHDNGGNNGPLSRLRSKSPLRSRLRSKSPLRYFKDSKSRTSSSKEEGRGVNENEGDEPKRRPSRRRRDRSGLSSSFHTRGTCSTVATDESSGSRSSASSANATSNDSNAMLRSKSTLRYFGGSSATLGKLRSKLGTGESSRRANKSKSWTTKEDQENARMDEWRQDTSSSHGRDSGAPSSKAEDVRPSSVVAWC